MDIEEKYVEVPIPLPQKGWWPRHDWTVQGNQSGEVMGIRVRYVMQGEGRAVLLVHGLASSLAVWGENIAPLAEEHTVYALDMPGHGKSDKPRGLGYNAVDGAHFLVRFMDTLGISSATLIGNSAGGLITTICALSYPQRVERLVLVSAAGLGRPLAWFLRLTSLPLVGELFHIPNVRNTRNMIKSLFYDPRPLRDDLVEELVQARNTPEAKRATLQAARSGVNLWGLRKQMMMLHRLEDFLKPILIIWGREDRVLPVSHAYRAAEVLSNCDVHIIPRCGHWPQMERPREFNQLVLGFLKGALDSAEEAA